MPDGNQPIISVRNLVVRFPAPDGDLVTVLDGVSFDVTRGETLVVMGGSGCGKSTLLNCLIGEVEPSEGSITYRLDGLGEIDLLSAEPAVVDEVRKRVGILFQSAALFNSLTVAENVALPLREHSHVDPKVVDIVVAMKLQQVQMLDHRDKFPAQLSGGQKKRAGLARATALDPVILFYDEPSAGLDPVTSAAIDDLIINLSEKLSVTSLVVTHEMDSAFRIADRMIMLDAGRVLRIGPRGDFEALRATPAESITSDSERLVHQFVNGLPATAEQSADAFSEYRRVLERG